MENVNQVWEKISKSTEISGKQFKSYFDMTAEERRTYTQAKCDRDNAEPGNLDQISGYDCPVCKNRGYISQVREGGLINGVPDYTQVNVDCKCRTIRAAIMRMKRSGLENVIKRYTFDAYQAKEPWQQYIKKTAQAFTKEQKGVFYIGGQSGCGKTHICTAITADFLRHGRAAYYMLWQDEVIKLKGNVTESAEYQRQIQRLKDVEVLYIDDFFKPVGDFPKPTAADIRIAYELINYRYNNGNLITIISSERYIKEILEIDEATGGRLIEYAGDYMVNVERQPGRNYRLRGTMI